MRLQDLYKPQRGRAESIEQDVVLSLASYLCLEVHKHSSWVVCWPCQEEAFAAVRPSSGVEGAAGTAGDGAREEEGGMEKRIVVRRMPIEVTIPAETGDGLILELDDQLEDTMMDAENLVREKVRRLGNGLKVRVDE